MIKFFLYVGGPNPRKVALVLEELALDYEMALIDIFKGEQHTAGFRAINFSCHQSQRQGAGDRG